METKTDKKKNYQFLILFLFLKKKIEMFYQDIYIYMCALIINVCAIIGAKKDSIHWKPKK